MKIYVDADACPVTRIIEDVCFEYSLDCTIVCDHNHLIYSDVCNVEMVDTGSDSADLLISNLISKNDLLITQDYGLASIALSKSAYVINHFGKEYTNENIQTLLAMRHMHQVIRKSSTARIKGPKKRVNADNKEFKASLIKIINNKGDKYEK